MAGHLHIRKLKAKKMATKRPTLKAEKRDIVGRKVKNLREKGFLPAGVYGRKLKSVNIQVGAKEIVSLYDKIGETGLVDLEVGKAKEKKTVLMKNPQYDPVSGNLIHIDFHQVDLTEKVTASVPVEIIGESPAAKRGEGILVHLLNEVEVEALPEDLPEKLIVDVAKLEKVNDILTIADLNIDEKKVKLSLGVDQVLVRIDPLAEEIKEEKPVEAETEAVSPAGEDQNKDQDKEKPEAKPEDNKEEKTA